MKQPGIDILMSTFNGERYLEQQIVSICEQTESNWRLIVRDDGSTDTTAAIIQSLAAQDQRISLSNSSGHNMGVAASFLTLLGESSAPLFAFCDQDDIWLPEKLTAQRAAIDTVAPELPALVYGDLQLVDDNLELLHASFLHYQKFQPGRQARWPACLMQNAVVGCNSMGNAELRRRALALPLAAWCDVIMHDWWLTMIAARFGQVLFCDCETIRYRQHGANQVGAKGGGARRYVRALFKETPVHKVRNYLDDVARQAQVFLTTYGDDLTEEDRTLLASVIRLEKVRGLNRLRALLGCYRGGARMLSPGRDWLTAVATLFS